MKFYTTTEISEILQVQKETIVRAINKGELKAIKLGRVFRIRETDFFNFIDSREVKNENIKS